MERAPARPAWWKLNMVVTGASPILGTCFLSQHLPEPSWEPRELEGRKEVPDVTWVDVLVAQVTRKPGLKGSQLLGFIGIVPWPPQW